MAENWMNDVALVLGKDPSYIRDKNLFREGQFTYYGQMVEEKGLERCWNDCLKQSSYEQVKHQVAEFNAGSKWKKRGIAIVPTMFGISFNAQFLNQSGKYQSLKSLSSSSAIQATAGRQPPKQPPILSVQRLPHPPNPASSSRLSLHLLFGLPLALFLSTSVNSLTRLLHLPLLIIATCPAHFHFKVFAFSTTSSTPVSARFLSFLHLSIHTYS